MSVLVVGSIAFDTVKTPFGYHKEILGGSASYSSVSARYFSPVNMVAVVGTDFTQKYFSIFRKKGIDTRGIQVEPGRTFRWEGEYDWDFNTAHTIATHLNVFAAFNPVIPEQYKNSKYVFLANIDPDIQNKVLAQVKNPKLIACDTMNFWIENKRTALLKLLKKIDVMLLNEGEARQLTDENNLVKAARALRKRGAKIIVIKKGEHGALLFSEDFVFCVPAFLLETLVDPTGAGDTFAGGFIGYLAQAKRVSLSRLKNALVVGSVMATFAVESFSLNRLLKITQKDIAQRLESFRQLTCY